MERRRPFVKETASACGGLASEVAKSYFDALGNTTDEALSFRICETFGKFALSLHTNSDYGCLDCASCLLLSYIFAKMEDSQKSEAVVLKVLGRSGFPSSHHLQLLRAMKRLLLDTETLSSKCFLTRSAFQAILAHLVGVIRSERDRLDLLGSAMGDAQLREEACNIIGILSALACDNGACN